MRNPAEEFNRKWRAANERVRAVEDKVHKAWLDFAAGRGEAPAAELMDEVGRLRRECDRELADLLANIQIRREGKPS